MKRAILISLSVMGACALSACGFTPLYATNGAAGALAAVEIRSPLTNTSYAGQTNDRTGFLLKQSLQDEFASSAGSPRYALDTIITEHRIPRGVRVNNVANRYEINLTVAYRLTEVATGKIMVTGTAPVIATYDSADPPFAGTVAAQNGEERAAQQAAIQIRLALGRYFAGRPLGSPGIVETPVPQDEANTPP